MARCCACGCKVNARGPVLLRVQRARPSQAAQAFWKKPLHRRFAARPFGRFPVLALLPHGAGDVLMSPVNKKSGGYHTRAHRALASFDPGASARCGPSARRADCSRAVPRRCTRHPPSGRRAVTPVSRPMDRLDHRDILCGRFGGFHVGDAMGGLVVTRLGHLHFRASPAVAALYALA